MPCSWPDPAALPAQWDHPQIHSGPKAAKNACKPPLPGLFGEPAHDLKGALIDIFQNVKGKIRALDAVASSGFFSPCGYLPSIVIP
jgi:hypothetical protein